MRRFLLALVLTLAPLASMAQGTPFDPAKFSLRDLRVIQAALAEWNAYKGLLDGKWGPGSQGALEGHFDFFFGFAPDEKLVADLALQFNGDGTKWAADFDPGLSLYLAIPQIGFNPVDLDGPHLTFATESRDLLVRLIFESAKQTEAMHLWSTVQHGAPSPVYSTTVNGVRITAAELASGRRLYLWSVPRGDSWMSLLIQSEPRQYGRAAVIAASLSQGPQDPLTPTPGGRLDQWRRGPGSPAVPPVVAAPPVSAPPATIARPVTPGPGPGIARPVAPGSGGIARGPDGVQPGVAPAPAVPAATPAGPRLAMPPLGILPRGQAALSAQRSVKRPENTWSTVVAVGATLWLAPADQVAGCDGITLMDGTPLFAQASDSGISLLRSASSSPVWLTVATGPSGAPDRMAGYPDLPGQSTQPQVVAMASVPATYAGAALIGSDGTLAGIATTERVVEAPALAALVGQVSPPPAPPEGFGGAIQPLVCLAPPA